MALRVCQEAGTTKWHSEGRTSADQGLANLHTWASVVCHLFLKLAVTQTVWPVKMKGFTTWPPTEKVCQLQSIFQTQAHQITKGCGLLGLGSNRLGSPSHLPQAFNCICFSSLKAFGILRSQSYNRLWSFSSTGSNILLVPKSFQLPCPAILPPFRWIEYSKGFYCQWGKHVYFFTKYFKDNHNNKWHMRQATGKSGEPYFPSFSLPF